ncbi:nucleoside triphosphate pyrophosphohydrolase [Alicyclobacillus fodiniaquatilis]|uniref:Nucleoside triphosphate pyrophosphohydrolase n=1 Tax=Alicyclobacillus fodiniaquatilis TaxID=1661150 RepID=A0ABW4JMG4_9BACL
MAVITYNKLVRDHIPEIIEQNGKRCVVRTLENDEYLEMLNAKLGEELKEYLESGEVEELADLAEVMLAVVKAKHISVKKFEAMMTSKRDQRGGFDKRIFLESVTE